MNGCIQVDDRMDCLKGNASIKILIKNNKDFSWNKIDTNEDNLYVVNNLSEIKAILEFFKNCPNMIKKCYEE